MIVRDQGDSWQLVAQPHHGDVCADIVRAWGNDRFAAPRGLESLATAARRHDDGWSVWERSPDVDLGEGRPLNVFDVGTEIHLAFYRAMIVAVADEDPYAGVLASMHGAGLYNGRYGTQSEFTMNLTEAWREQVEAYVAERTATHDARAAELGIPEDQRWVEYKLLQVSDRLCLYFCLNDLEAGTEADLAPVPVDYDGDEATMAIRPAGPWQVSLAPYPFADPELELTLRRKVLPKQSWGSRHEFAAAYDAAPFEDRAIALRPG
jgi:Protein of unknown function (DUF3891)